jgi:hypothetical protein
VGTNISFTIFISNAHYGFDHLNTTGEIALPHVVLTGKIDIEDIFTILEPLLIRNEQTVLRTIDAYIDRNKNAILVEALAIENGIKRTFLVMISRREDGVVVRLYPKFDVEKTDGVKKILAELAKQLRGAFPDLQVGETNLQEYLN